MSRFPLSLTAGPLVPHGWSPCPSWLVPLSLMAGPLVPHGWSPCPSWLVPLSLMAGPLVPHGWSPCPSWLVPLSLMAGPLVPHGWSPCPSWLVPFSHDPPVCGSKPEGGGGRRGQQNSVVDLRLWVWVNLFFFFFLQNCQFFKKCQGVKILNNVSAGGSVQRLTA